MHYPPNTWPTGDDHSFAFTARERQTLYDHRAEPAIVVSRRAAPPVRGLVLRHEAEHVIQDAHGAAIGPVAINLQNALPVDAFYTAMPHERDADAAATRFAAASGILGTPEQLTGRDRMLFAAPWQPPDLATLPDRLLAFTLFYPDRFDNECRTAADPFRADPDQLLDALTPDGAAIRRALRDRFTQTLNELVDHDVSREEWATWPRQRVNEFTDGLKNQVVEHELLIREAIATIRRA